MSTTKTGLIAILSLLLLCSGINAHAQSYEDALLAGGLLVDNTFTHKGRSFYRTFSLAWHRINPRISGDIAVREEPNARSGHKVLVTFNRQIVYVGVIRSGNFNYSQLADQAAQQSSQRIQSLIVQRIANNDQDLAGDEI